MSDEIRRAIARNRFVENARKAFRPGRRKHCHICGKFRYVAHAHHVVPLAEQFDRGFVRPDQEFVWLCPNHHAMIHIAIDGNPPDHIRGRRIAPIIRDLDEGELKSFIDLAERSSRMPT